MQGNSKATATLQRAMTATERARDLVAATCEILEWQTGPASAPTCEIWEAKIALSRATGTLQSLAQRLDH